MFDHRWVAAVHSAIEFNTFRTVVARTTPLLAAGVDRSIDRIGCRSVTFLNQFYIIGTTLFQMQSIYVIHVQNTHKHIIETKRINRRGVEEAKKYI